jgi:cell wall-associated NlpC family hydrolase
MRNIATTLFYAMLLCLFATTASAKDNRHATATKGHKSVAHKTHQTIAKSKQHTKKSAHKHQQAAAKTGRHNQKTAQKHPTSRTDHHKVALHKPLPAANQARNDKSTSSTSSQTPTPATETSSLTTPEINRPVPLPLQSLASPVAGNSTANQDNGNREPSAKPESSTAGEGGGLMEAMKKRAEPLLVAMGLLGTPYKIGGTNPDKGVDCSGLVHYVYKQAANLDLPHSAKALSQNGTAVKKDDLQPGDLVFFHTLRKRFSHVGIYAGDGKFVHADSRQVKEVMVSSLDSQYWAKHFDGARRLPLDAQSK